MLGAWLGTQALKCACRLDPCQHQASGLGSLHSVFTASAPPGGQKQTPSVSYPGSPHIFCHPVSLISLFKTQLRGHLPQGALLYPPGSVGCMSLIPQSLHLPPGIIMTSACARSLSGEWASRAGTMTYLGLCLQHLGQSLSQTGAQ